MKEIDRIIFKKEIRPFLIFFGSLISIFILVVLFRRFQGIRLYNRIKSHRIVYVYDTFYLHKLDFSAYLTDTEQAKAFLNYYDSVAQKDTSLPVGFSIQFATMNEGVFILNNEDWHGQRVIFPVVDIDTTSFVYPYDIWYVYRPSVHDIMANDSLQQWFAHKTDSIIEHEPYSERQRALLHPEQFRRP